MPTTPMLRVRTVVTGVAGSPYYLVGYFEDLTDNEQQCVDAWAAFTSAAAANQPTGSNWLTEGDVEVVDPITGDTIGVRGADQVLVLGSTNLPLLPPASQALIRWRTGVYVGGREIRGRTNMPLQFQDNATSGGTVKGSVQTFYKERADTLVNQITAEHVVWSKTNGRWERTVTASVWDQFSVLRSRRD